MATLPLTAMPASFVAGTTVTYTRTLPDYPPASWDLKVTLAGASQVVVTAAASGTDFVVTFEPSNTVGFTPGAYEFEERVIQKVADAGHEKKEATVGKGPVSLERNLITATGAAAQSFDEKMLVAIEVKLFGRITTDQETLQIVDTVIARIPVEQLDKMHQKYANRVELQRSPNAAIGSVNINFGSDRSSW